MISLPDTLSSLDDVAENVRQYYEQVEGGYRLQPIEPLRNSMKNAKQERAQLAEDLKATRTQMEAFKNIDPAKYAQLLERETQLMEFEQNKGGEIDRIRAEMARSYDGKLSAAEQERNRAKQAAENIARENLIGSALGKAGVNELGMRYLANQLAAEVTFEWHGDRLVPKLLDANGAQRLNENFDPLTLDDLLAAHRREAPVFFNTQFPNGGGSGANAQSGTEPPAHKPLKDFTAAEIKNFNARHNDAGAYNRALLAQNKTQK